MGEDSSEGASKQAMGSIKEAIGKVTGDRSLEVEGAAEKAIGKTGPGLGRAEDVVHDALKR